MAKMEIDIVLMPGEDEPLLRSYLRTRFGVQVTRSPEQYSSAVTYEITGPDQALGRVKSWHNAKRQSRPDLAGKPPVGKGEKRS